MPVGMRKLSQHLQRLVSTGRATAPTRDLARLHTSLVATRLSGRVEGDASAARQTLEGDVRDGDLGLAFAELELVYEADRVVDGGASELGDGAIAEAHVERDAVEAVAVAGFADLGFILEPLVPGGLFAGLLQVQDYCAKCGGRMVLFNLPDETTEALIGFNLLDQFTRADSLEEAIDIAQRPVVASARGSWLSQLLGKGRAAA